MLASNNLSSKDELKRVECIQASNKKVELKSLLNPISSSQAISPSTLQASIRPTNDSIYPARSLHRHLARHARLLLFVASLSILVVAAAPPPTVCPVCLVCPAMWMPDPKRDGHQPQAPGVSVASAAMASGVVGHGVGRWDAIVGDGMESLTLFWHLVARFGAVVRLNRFARLWS